MKLTELEPRWMEHEGKRIGFVFLSPVQATRHDGSKRNPPHRMTCIVSPTSMDVQRQVAERMFGYDDYNVVPCRPECCWTVQGGIDGQVLKQ